MTYKKAGAFGGEEKTPAALLAEEFKNNLQHTVPGERYAVLPAHGELLITR